MVDDAAPLSSVMVPPVSAAEVPARIEMAPDAPPVADPANTPMSPDTPDSVVPLLNSITPLSPVLAAPASPVRMRTSPELVLDEPPSPLENTTEPPIFLPDPATMVTSPPVDGAVEALPAINNMCPATVFTFVAAPLDNRIAAPAPPAPLPTSRLIAPP